MLLKFEINTKPVPQARPRFFVRCRKCKYKRLLGQTALKEVCRKCRHAVGVFDPNNCKTFKEVVAWQAMLSARESGIREPVKDPIALKVIFMMGENGKERFHTKRPDIDNLAKAVKDALKGIIYKDDSQIVEAHLYKRFGEYQIKVEIVTLEGE